MTDQVQVSAHVLDEGYVLAARYEVVRTLGVGGMATVYLAKDRREQGTLVALKVLHKEHAKDKTYVERFVREVKTMHGIEHPNVVRSYDVGIDGGHIYFSMEYIHGETLETLMSKKSFSIREVIELATAICRGLSAVHARDVIHRDLKPANIMITEDGQVKLLDFGVVRIKSSRLTRPNQKLGSVCYIAPEVWLEERITPAVDLYSLGVVLYELVTGEVPFEDPSVAKLLTLHLEGDIVSPRKHNPRVPMWLDKLIVKLLAKTPRGRPRSADEVIQILNEHRPSEASPEITPPESSPTILEKPAEKFTPVAANRAREKTYVFTLSATQVFEANAAQPKPRRKATVVLTLPRRAALVIEIESPSKDVIAFGLFLASLQILDALLTHIGVQTWGVAAEGNLFMRTLMHTFGPENALLGAKAFAILLVGIMTVLAKRRKLFKNLVGALSLIYLCAAILPWFYLLTIYALRLH